MVGGYLHSRVMIAAYQRSKSPIASSTGEPRGDAAHLGCVLGLRTLLRWSDTVMVALQHLLEELLATDGSSARVGSAGGGPWLACRTWWSLSRPTFASRCIRNQHGKGEGCDRVWRHAA